MTPPEVVGTPLQYLPPNAKFPEACEPFQGVWLHGTEVGREISRAGWKPDLLTNTIYGAAVYLSREKWWPSYSDVFECVLGLEPSEVMFRFSSKRGEGSTQNHLLWFIQEEGKGSVQKEPSRGLSWQNQFIKAFFLTRKIKAIHFVENEVEVVAVYDPSCIRVLRS